MQDGCLIEVETRRGYDADSYILWAESKKNNYILIDIKYAALTKSCKKYVVPHMYDVPLYLLPLRLTGGSGHSRPGLGKRAAYSSDGSK